MSLTFIKLPTSHFLPTLSEFDASNYSGYVVSFRMNERAIQDRAGFGYLKTVPERDEYEQLAALRAMGLANQEELARLQELQTTCVTDDGLAADLERLALELHTCTPADLPRKLLRDRVFVSTEPKLAQIVTDADGCITTVSRGFTEMCGYTLDEIRGKKPGSFLQGPGTDPAAVDLLRQAIRDRRPCSVELLNYTKFGEPYRVQIDLKPVIDRTGRLEGFKATETLKRKLEVGSWKSEV